MRRPGIIRPLAVLLGALWGAAAGPADAASVTTAPFGVDSDGRPVSKTTLRNDWGMSVSAIDFGATLTAVETPDRGGHAANVALSLPTVAAYERSQRRWASTIGRYAGRIGGARFTLDGQAHTLESGRNGVTLHGGSRGYDKRVWTSHPVSDRRSVGVRFSLVSPDGDQGFPGRLDISVTYRLMRSSNELRIEYEARTDRPTVVNLTNHGFFNLAGAGRGDVRDHRLWLDAERYAEVDAFKIPTGRLAPVAGTVLDFTKPASIGARLKLDDLLLASSQGFDHSIPFRTPGGALRPVAWIEDPRSGRRLEISTTEPSVQLNSGNGFDGSEVGSEGVAYRQYAGLAFETQHLPDSPNRPMFPSTILRPEDRFRSTTVLNFKLIPVARSNHSGAKRLHASGRLTRRERLFEAGRKISGRERPAHAAVGRLLMSRQQWRLPVSAPRSAVGAASPETGPDEGPGGMEIRRTIGAIKFTLSPCATVPSPSSV